MHPIFILPVLVLVSLSFYLLVEAVYNVFFHPLRDFPGPFSAKVNRLSITYYSWNGNMVKRITKLHEKYGDVVRVAPGELSYISEQAWPDIVGHKTATGQGDLPKELLMARALPNRAASIFVAPDEDHRRMRKLQSHMFSEKALHAQEPMINVYVDKLMTRLHEEALKPDPTANLVKWYNFTTFDILGDLAFGDSFGCLRADIMHPWIVNIFRSIKDGAYHRLARNFPSPIYEFMRYMQPAGLREGGVEEFAFASKRARERMAQGATDRKDFMSYMLKYNDEKGMTPQEIESNASILIIAGSETTATFLSGITYNLLRTPEVLKKLTDLVRTTFPSESDINVVSVQQLEYFTACIEEGFRTYPPVPSGLIRNTTKGGNIICDRWVPEDTIVYVTQWAAYHSRSNFADPEVFDPERWLKDPPAKYANDKRKVVQPFSQGPRNCIGRNLAYAEIRLILARMLWNFDMELQSGSDDWTDQKVWILYEKKPLMVKLTPRSV